ncbi:SRPBCC family protein [Dermatophilaceae bacterium Sec6.4]
MIADRWGVTPADIAMNYGCDDVVAAPVMQAWRGVTVHAPAENVWPWIVQLRLAPYSYDWIDNLGRRSPQELQDLPDPVVGSPFMATAGRSVGQVLSVTPGEQLTARILASVMSYVVVPAGADSRLLMKIVMGSGKAFAPLVSMGDLVMARRQLLNLKALAERSAS